jgi:hypothetical protein
MEGIEAPPALHGGWQRTRYRVGQFFRGLGAQMRPGEAMLVAGVLNERAQACFTAMPVDIQRHSLNVLHTLQRAGYTEPALAAAALLHDAGKCAAQSGAVKLGLWLRGPLVMAEALAPGRLRRWAVDDPAAGWRYAVYVQLAHPTIGAAWAAEAGCSPLTCWLIAHHQDKPTTALTATPDEAERTRLLAALQWADELN